MHVRDFRDTIFGGNEAARLLGFVTLFIVTQPIYKPLLLRFRYTPLFSAFIQIYVAIRETTLSQPNKAGGNFT